MFGLNAYTQTNKLLRFQTIDDRSEPVLPAVRALRPNAYRSEGQRQVVRDHYEPFDRPVFFRDQAAYGLAAQIHIGLRLGQFDRLIVNDAASYQRPALFTLYLRLKLRRQQIDEHKPEIVSRLCVFRAWITQAHYQPIAHVRP